MQTTLHVSPKKHGANLQGIFDEYDRLSHASGLQLNADKTEILDIDESQYKIKYYGVEHCLKGSVSVKLNGIYFNKDENRMKNENLTALIDKIECMLRGWRARQLSLLGKILIYKTFGMSQVLYTLSVVSLDKNQYKRLTSMFTNFLWGRELLDVIARGRIGAERLNTPVEWGGFGMIQYEKVLEGINCRQLAKMYDPAYDHPIKFITLKNDAHFATGKSLTSIADDMAKKAHCAMTLGMSKHVKKLSNLQISEDAVLTDILGATDIGRIIKPRWINTGETARLVHILGCSSIKDILDEGTEAIRQSKKIVKAYYLRIIKLLWRSNCQCELIQNEKFPTSNGRYKLIHMITSKEFREFLNGSVKMLHPKIDLSVDINDNYGRYSIKNYFSRIKRLANTRHKNTLLRIWNGDCLSNSRLIHLGIVNTNLCPNCGLLDTPCHLLIECQTATLTWQRLMVKIPKDPTITLMEYAIGFYDGRIEMSIKAEILKMLMHFRNMDSDAIHTRLRNYFMSINPNNEKIRTLFS